MPATMSLRDCARLITAVQEAGGRAPKPLTNILSGAHLLADYQAPSDPARAIVAAAVAGELTEKRLDGMLADYGTAQLASTSRGELRQRSEKLFCEAFHKALKDGSCDALLDSLRPVFDEHAEQITAAMSMIPPTGSAEAFLATAEPAAVTAWQGLDQHLEKIQAIGAIAAQFGCRVAPFPQIKEYPLADNFRLDDRAIMATGGPIMADSALFHGPGTHRASPWCRAALHLHSVESAQIRYDEFAASEWDRQHGGAVTSWIDDKGQAHEMPRPQNPYRATTLAKR